MRSNTMDAFMSNVLFAFRARDTACEDDKGVILAREDALAPRVSRVMVFIAHPIPAVANACKGAVMICA